MGLPRRCIHSIVGMSAAVAPCAVEARLAQEPSPAVVETLGLEQFPDRQIDPSVPTAVPWSMRALPTSSASALPARRSGPDDAAQREFEPAEPEQVSPRGVGLLIGGGVTSFCGALALFGGLAIRAQYEPEPPKARDPDCGEPCAGFSFPEPQGTVLLAVGTLALIVGPALLGVGGYLYRSSKKLRPRVQRSLHGTWTAGLMLEF